jgi:D-alanyl-D-alanine carboxypeptidase
MTTLLSQNGWAASADRNAIGIHNYLIDGANQHFAMCANAAPVLGAFLAEFNKLIEPINKPGAVFDDWGYNFELIPNSKDYSNHCSGTAIDVNATKHQWKAATSGYTTVQETAIDGLCKKYGIRWGWRYLHGFKDPMHFEIIETPAQVAARIIKMKLAMPAVMK